MLFISCKSFKCGGIMAKFIRKIYKGINWYFMGNISTDNLIKIIVIGFSLAFVIRMILVIQIMILTH